MSAQKLKQLFQSGQIKQCESFAVQCLQGNPNDKVAHFFLAQAQLSLGSYPECQTSLNNVYGLVQKGTDDALLFNAYQLQDQLAQRLKESTNQKTKKQGIDIQISNKFQIIDFLDRKLKFDKMLEETEIYLLVLLEDSRYKEIEDTYLWLMGHQALNNSQKVEYAAKIYEIDQFYNPYTRLDALFPKLCKLDPVSPALKPLAAKMLEYLDKQGGKKKIGDLQNDSNLPQFTNYLAQLKSVSEIVFTQPEDIFKNKFTVRMFSRYLSTVAVTTVFLSEEWNQFEQKIKLLLSSETLQREIQNEDPILLLQMWSYIDVAKSVKDAKIPGFDELQASKLPLETLQQTLQRYSDDQSSQSQYANAYVALVALSQHFPTQLDSKSIYQKIKQALFIAGKAQYLKLTPYKGTDDLKIYLNCLSLKLSLEKDLHQENLKQAQNVFEKCQQSSSPQVCSMYTSIISQLQWQSDLQAGRWLQAIEGLDILVKEQPSQSDFALVKKAQIQLCHVQELVNEQLDQQTLIVGIMNSIQFAQTIEADNLLLQGYLMWTYPQIFECDSKQTLNKWLQALKKDQTNPGIYYALAVHYFVAEDYKRASGCLEKALKLKADHEQALVLSYYLAQTSEQRLLLVDRFMEVNRNIAVTYYFKGLLMQQKQDWIQAIDMYQNAIKFYGIQQSKVNYNLEPKLDLSIFKNPFGIYGQANAAVCCVYLSECFMKIDKPTVALKCFMQGIEEISQVSVELPLPLTDEIAQLLEIVSLGCLLPNNLQMQTDPLLVILAKFSPSKWAIECLMQGARLIGDPQRAISILSVALRCQPTLNMLAYILTQLIANVTTLVEQGAIFENGRVEMLTETPAVISRLDLLIRFVCERPQLMSCQNLQKMRLNALFAIAQRTLSKERYREAMLAAAQLHEAKLPGWQSLILDYAKIIHEYQRFDQSDPSLQDLKMTLVKQAIVQDPQQANLWVHLHMFSKDDLVRQRAIYKAYELEPESNFVQETILRFFLQTKQWNKAFKIIVKSYQGATNAGEPQQPLVLASLAYMHAICYFESGQKTHCLEALSLIRLVQREDMRQLLSEVYIYLSHYNGDYMRTLSYLQSKPKDHVTDLMLLKAYFGSSIFTYEQVRAKADQKAKELLKTVIEAEMIDDQQLLIYTTDLTQKFLDDPVSISPKLALYQELCLQRKVTPKTVLLDVPDLKQGLQKLDTSQQRVLLIQGLRLVQLRDGKVNEATTTLEDPLNKKDSVQEPKANYTQSILEAARLKPQYLSSAQHKALLRLYLKSKEDPNTFQQGLFSQSLATHQNQAEIQGLYLFLKKRQENKENGMAQLMRDPLSIKANSEWLWSLLKEGKVHQATTAFKIVASRIDSGMLGGDRQEFDKLGKFIEALQGKDGDIEARLKLIAGLCTTLEGCTQNAGEEDVRRVACKILKALTHLSDQTQDQLIQLIFQVLQIVLFEQGHFMVYNKLLKEILNAATVAHQSSPESAFSKSLRILTISNYSLLQQASTLVQLKKVTQVLGILQQLDQLPKMIGLEKPVAAQSLMKARALIAVQTFDQVFSAVKQDDSLEKDYMLAVSLYGAQEYSQFYLACLGLVAGAKQGDVSQWNLAYAYYLKAVGEMTFLMAKRQNVKLKDDFTQAEDKYNVDFFAYKARTSLTKCLNNLQACGEDEGMLAKAVKTMLDQI